MVLYISWPEKVENSSSFSANFVSIYKNLFIIILITTRKKSLGTVPVLGACHFSLFRTTATCATFSIFAPPHHRAVISAKIFAPPHQRHCDTALLNISATAPHFREKTRAINKFGWSGCSSSPSTKHNQNHDQCPVFLDSMQLVSLAV